MSITSKALLALVALFLAMSIATDFMPVREASDLDQLQRYVGNDPWAVAGVRPGDKLAQHLQTLGPPDKETAHNNDRVLYWRRSGELTLSVNGVGVITEAFGDTLSAAGRTLVYASLGEAEIQRILGPGRVRRHTRPSGSGVISLGWEETGRTITYENQGVRFEVGLENDSVKYVRATSVP